MKKSIAVLADSHGNATALKAAVTDAQANGADEFWALGDMAFAGASSKECYELLNSINTTQFIMGNWESIYNMALAKRPFDMDDPTDVYFLTLASYEHARLSQSEETQIRSLSMNSQLQIAGLNISLSHNLPNKNYGHTLFPAEDQAGFDEITPSEDTDIALYGHIHMPIWRYTTTGQIILNPGSIGQFWATRPRLLQNRDASYLLLTFTNHGLENVDFRRVPYDFANELQFAKDHDFPYVDLYEKLMTTGIASTHDLDLLRKVNQEHHYDERVNEFLASL